MRLVVTAENYEEALRFYRDVLILKERADSRPKEDMRRFSRQAQQRLS